MSVPEEVVVQGTRILNVPGNLITAFFRNTDLLRNFRWRLTFPDDITDERGGRHTIRPDDCQSLDFPFPSIDPVQWAFNGKITQYANAPESSGTFNVNLYEESSCRVMVALEAWKSMIRNPDGTRNYPYPKPGQTGVRTYKKDLMLQLTDGLKVPKAQITFRGCWPTNTSSTQLTYDGPSDKVVITQTFALDDVIFVPLESRFSDIFRSGNLLNGARQLLGF